MRALPAVVLALLVTASPARAEGKVEWVKGYPKGGPKPGQILVKAKAVPDKGCEIVGATVDYFVNGGVGREIKLKLNAAGGIDETVIDGLDPGVTYVIFLHVKQTANSSEGPTELATLREVMATPSKR